MAESEYDYLIGTAASAAGIEVGLALLVTQANDAKDAAELAQAQAENAQAQAGVHEDNAEQFAADAQTAEGNAATSEANAASSANAASVSAGEAEAAKQAAEAAAAEAKLTSEVEAGTSRTLTTADNGKMIIFTAATAVQLTLPESATESLPQDYEVGIYQAGAGQVEVLTEGADVLENIDGHTKLEGQRAAGHIFLRIAGSPNTYVFTGRTAA